MLRLFTKRLEKGIIMIKRTIGITTFLITTLGIILVYCILCAKNVELERERDYWRDRIPTITEIQEQVGAEPDGIIGPETIEKWHKATTLRVYTKGGEK